jgi:hypothetical protein
MTARTFEDSSGAQWEVFEVHRALQKAGAVSVGLENGWLSFVNGETKRRLAPFPGNWAAFSDAELARLCQAARPAAPARFPFDRPMRPRIRRSEADDRSKGKSSDDAGERAGDPSGLDVAPSDAGSPSESEVEQTVREFAREARVRGLAVVDAMIELKARLIERHPGTDSPARDRRRVRQWFVASYYFDRKE